MDRRTTKKIGWLTAKEYDFIYSRSPRLCVDLIVKNKKGDTLLSLRKIEPYKNKWHVPGGKVSFREPIEKAIQRIAIAEFNSKVIVHKMIGYMEFLRETQGSKKRHTVSIAFLVKLANENISGSWQGEELEFFSKIPPNTHPVHAKFLKSLE